jgi:hypothetical protein
MRFQDYAFAAGAIAAAYVVWKVLGVGRATVAAADKFVTGLNFDPATLGPSAELSEPAKLSEADYLRLGYLERTPGGGTRITPRGEEYIQRQQQIGG